MNSNGSFAHGINNMTYIDNSMSSVMNVSFTSSWSDANEAAYICVHSY